MSEKLPLVTFSRYTPVRFAPAIAIADGRDSLIEIFERFVLIDAFTKIP